MPRVFRGGGSLMEALPGGAERMLRLARQRESQQSAGGDTVDLALISHRMRGFHADKARTRGKAELQSQQSLPSSIETKRFVNLNLTKTSE